ncbi:MAG: AAA family ATPase [Blautia sp.]|nr:AAA family ATPase [Blautia sp.]MCM1201847.1 AAA family ATPase [Bacteroides fragilis]
MRIAEEIAEEIYRVYSSGKSGVVLEMEHKQEWEPVIRILWEKYYRGKGTAKAGLDIFYDKKEINGKIYFAPVIHQIGNMTSRRMENDELGLENVSTDSYLAVALENAAAKSGIGFLVLNHYQLIEQPYKAKLLLSLLRILRTGEREKGPLVLITVDKRGHLPGELLPYVHIIQGKKPDASEIQEMVGQIFSRRNQKPGEGLKREIVSYLQGFHTYEFEYLFREAEMLYGEKAFDEKEKRILELIGSEKVKLLEKERLLEWKMVKHVDMANMDVLAEYLQESGAVMRNLEDAVQNGVEVPKGILIMGLPGTGKSLFAQYAAAALKMPLIRLEMGKMMGGHVGDSERNLRTAQKQAEEMAPCILWIDEIEKGFAGAGGKGKDGGEYLQRMTGGFLTWLQEKKSSCYVIATANSIDGLPPEFFRQGRFDRCFYTAMPSGSEIRNILKVHLQKPGRAHVEPAAEEAVSRIIQLARTKKRFMTGADAGALVSNTFRRLYLDYGKQKEITDKKEYDRENLAGAMEKEFEKMKVFSETNGKEIAQYDRSLKKSNFINASSPKEDTDASSKRYDEYLRSFMEEKQKETESGQ